MVECGVVESGPVVVVLVVLLMLFFSAVSFVVFSAVFSVGSACGVIG